MLKYTVAKVRVEHKVVKVQWQERSMYIKALYVSHTLHVGM